MHYFRDPRHLPTTHTTPQSGIHLIVDKTTSIVIFVNKNVYYCRMFVPCIHSIKAWIFLFQIIIFPSHLADPL